MEQKSLKKNAFFSALQSFFRLLFPLITFPYVSRILLPDGIGKVNFANNIVSYFIILASLGIGGYATREASKIKNDKLTLTKFFKEMLSINCVCCICAYILFFLTIVFIPKFSEYHKLLLACSINIFFSVLSIDWIYTAHEDFKFLTLRSFIIQIISLIYLFLFVRTKDDIVYYALFGVFINIANNTTNFIFVKRYLDFKPKIHLEIKKHLKPVFIFFGITVVTSIYSLFDTTMLGFLSNDVQIGYYTASTKLGHMFLSMFTAITVVLLPRLTDYVQNKEENKFNELVEKSVNILILLSIPTTTGIILLAKPVILLLNGNDYLPAIPCMRIIAPIIIFISFSNLIGAQILPSLGKEKISFYSYLLGAFTNLSLNSLLIPKYGANGAAIATICAESIVTIIQLLYTKKILFSKDTFITFIESIISTMFMGFIIFLLLHIINNIIFQLIISFIIGVIVYAISLILFKNKYILFYLNIFKDIIKKKVHKL